MCAIGRITLVLIGLISGTCLVNLPASAQPSFLPQIVPGHRFDFHDDMDGRRLADIRLNIVERNGVRSLDLVIAAVGPHVQPIPGYQGVSGANRHTAEQLENILSGRFAFEVKTSAVGSKPWNGVWHAGKYGPIPERRLGKDGRIDVLAVTPREYPLEVIVETGSLSGGRQTTELWFDGVPRLRINYEIEGNVARILSFDSLAHLPVRGAVNLAQEKADEPKEKPWIPPIKDADWKARDLEGKWVLFDNLTGDSATKRKGFLQYLARHKEHELLEMIALRGPSTQAAWLLAIDEAPQWLRVAAWLRNDSAAGHDEPETRKILVKHHPARSLPWLSKYADEAFLGKGEKENPRSRASNPLLPDLLALKRLTIAPLGLDKMLPPLQPVDVFRHLDAPADLAEFGNRQRAEAGKVYVHQVLRAIRQFEKSGKFREPWMGKIRQLTKHSHPQVRQAAFLSFTYFAREMEPRDSVVDELRKVADNRKETPAIREAALMAYSYFGHPQVYVRLHELTSDPADPIWRVAVSRLNDIGDDFTVKHLDRIDRTNLPPPEADLLVQVRNTLRDRANNPMRPRTVHYEIAVLRIERAAWAELTKSPLAKTLTPWTRAFFVDQADFQFDRHLESVHNEFAPRYAVADPPALTRLVRGLVVDILNTPTPHRKKPAN